MAEISGEMVTLVASAGAVAGMATQELAPIPVITGKGIFQAFVGIAVAVGGWFLDSDGLGDFVEGYGIGLVAGAVL